MIPRRHIAVLVAPLLLSGCFGADDGAVQGYIEGTYVYVSAETAGRLVERPVSAGDTVEAGALIARLDDSEEKEALAEAEARTAQAKAQLANLLSGQREEEISVIAARLTEARANFNLAEEDYRRKLLLRERGTVAQSVVDDAKAKREAASATVEGTERELIVAKLPARPDEIAAAERNVAAEEAALAQAKIQLERRTLVAPSAGHIEKTFYEAGERVNAGQPIVSLLPEANKKVRFFLPEQQLARVKIGDRIAVSCDGCTSGLEAEIDRVATEAEFTPPILYSKESRDKLVFRIEAQPLGATTDLKVGQPVDVRLIGQREAGS
jgi:HlyD family secretion protein